MKIDKWAKLRRAVERNISQGGGSRSVKWNDGVLSALMFVVGQMDELDEEERISGEMQ